MSYSIIPTHRFEKELKRLAKKFPSLKKEYAILIADISENPKSALPLLQKAKAKEAEQESLPTYI